jgi:hypothetical protein
VKGVDPATEVWKHSTAEGTELVVMLAIAKHADPDGYAWPGPKTLREMARRGDQSVKAAIAKMEAAGELAVLRGSGRGHASLYRILLGQPEGAGDREVLLAWLRSKTTPFLTSLYERVSSTTPFGAKERGSPPTPFRAERGSSANGERGSSASSSPGAYRKELPVVEEKPSTTSPAATKAVAKKTEEPRPDVDGLCVLLAEQIIANGANREKYLTKAKTAGWQQEMRLLLDKDLAVDQHGQPVPPAQRIEKARKAIIWCQASSFWRKNVMCPEKLREKYDQLRLAALEEQQQNGNGHRVSNGHGPPQRSSPPEFNPAVAPPFKGPELAAFYGLDPQEVPS